MDNLSELIEKTGLSIGQVALYLGMDYYTLKKILNGKSTVFPATLERIYELLNHPDDINWYIEEVKKTNNEYKEIYQQLSDELVDRVRRNV